MEEQTSYIKEIYIERKPNLSIFVSSLTNQKIIEILSEIEKIEDKKSEIYIGIKEKCKVEELEKALTSEIQNRKENNVQKTSFDSLLEFEEYEIKHSILKK